MCQILNTIDNKPILILGGHGPTGAPEHFLNKFNADYIVMGEGEITFIELLKTISSSKKELDKIKGIAFRENGKIKINPPRPLIKDLNKLPFPAWEDFPMEHYVLSKHIAAKHTDRCAPILGSRGCPHRCSFCYRMDTGYRLRDPENIIEEMKKLHKDYHVTHFIFADENLMSTKKIALDFCKAVMSSGLKVKWNCMGRLSVANVDILKEMKKAGCEYINYGVESLDQNVLNLMNKKQTVQEAFSGIDNTISVGIMPGLNILWGHPGDTLETLQKNKEFLKRYNTTVQVRTIKPVTPYPGTALFKLAKEKGLLKDAQDFYQKYVNSDKMTVNFTDIEEDEFYKHLFEANKEVLQLSLIHI